MTNYDAVRIVGDHGTKMTNAKDEFKKTDGFSVWFPSNYMNAKILFPVMRPLDIYSIMSSDFNIYPLYS